MPISLTALLFSSPARLIPAGSLLTPTVILPVTAPAGALLRVTLHLLDADRVNPLIEFDYALERLLGPDVRHICGGHWQGVEAIDPETGLPVTPQATAGFVGGTAGPLGRVLRDKGLWTVRGRLDLPVPLVLGWQIDLVTPS